MGSLTLAPADMPQRWAALKAENARLRAALKPFAEAAADTAGYPEDHAIGCDPCMELAIKIEDGAFAPLKVLHLRAAAIAYEQNATEK